MLNLTKNIGDARVYKTDPEKRDVTRDEFEFLRIQIWREQGIDIRFEKLPLQALAGINRVEQPRQPYLITSAGKAMQRDMALRFIAEKMVREYGYSYDMMRVAVPIPGFSPEERARAVFYEDAKQFHPLVLVETVDKPFFTTSFEELTREAVEKARAFEAQYAIVVTYSCDFIALDIELWSESCPKQAKLPEIPFAPVKKETIEME